MQLSDVFEQLSQGELSQLKMGSNDEIGIRPCDYGKIIPHINLGLTEIYKRFNLKNSEVVVQQYDQISTYFLDKRYAVTNESSDMPIKYIIDSVYQPFTDNVLRIEAIHNEIGEVLYSNQDEQYFKNSDKYWGITTPSYNSIQVPYPEKENQMIVTYRADHDPIVFDSSMQLEDIQVPISSAYLEALLMYVAGRVYTNMGTNEGNEGNNYTAKFEASINKIVQYNLMNTNDTLNTKLDKNGWV